MYGATGAIGSSPIASSAIASTGHPGDHYLTGTVTAYTLGLNAATITPVYIASRLRVSAAIGSSPVAKLPIASSTFYFGTIFKVDPANYVVAGNPAYFSGSGRIKACFHWGASGSAVAYWTTPSTAATFAVPTVAYGLSADKKNFKVVKTNAEIRAGQ